tara:strand:- start:10262 stop:11089 length:828 start_codon:yes stop_codon:yes gene_type:complete
MISIVIPSIGRSDTIEKSLVSAQATEKSLVKEILVLDNSQSQEFNSRLKDSIEKLNDERFTIIEYEERRPMAQSWNGAFEYISQPWVLYLHDDDEILPDKFNLLADYLNNCKDSSFLSFDYLIGLSAGSKCQKIRSRREKRLKGSVYQKIISDCPKFVSTIINVKCLEDIGGWSENTGYFLDFVGFIELASLKEPQFLDVVIGLYNIHDDNESSISKRDYMYGRFIPIVSKKVFEKLSEEEDRRQFVRLLNNFVYPNQSRSVIFRLARKIEMLYD